MTPEPIIAERDALRAACQSMLDCLLDVVGEHAEDRFGLKPESYEAMIADARAALILVDARAALGEQKGAGA